MTFDSFSFLLFFVIVLAVTRGPFPWTARKAVLLVGSYLFYALWNPPFVLLLWISTLADWWIGAALHRSRVRRHRRLLLGLSLLVNLGLLSAFKYGGFFVENFNAMLSTLSLPVLSGRFSVILPVGISFYTFQTLSYTIDIYRRELEPEDNFLNYALYVTFFPQLVAGPIVRAKEFLPQCRTAPKLRHGVVEWGASLMIIGLFSKKVVADYFMAPITEHVFESASMPSTLAAWTGTLAFAVQIFCDFAGYSLIAIGAALCLGFRLRDNFRFPYAAIGFSDFWRRWHISLSTWLRDYLYMSLGGNRVGTGRIFRNLVITMFLGGLWHGAAWTFIVWGLIHGCFLVLERVLRSFLGALGVWSTWLGQRTLQLATFVAVCLAWVFFRADGVGRSGKIVAAMFGANPTADALTVGASQVAYAFVAAAFILQAHWWMRHTTLEGAAQRFPWWVRSLILGGMLVLLALSPSEDRAFIYFQF